MNNPNTYFPELPLYYMELPTRYNKEELYRAIKQPRKFLNEARYLYSSSKFRYKYRNIDQRNPLLEDWDNLFILDACRHDILNKLDVFDVDVDYRILESSTSPEFCDNYMSGNQFHDTVYVTANPFGAQVDDDCFYNK